LSSVSWGGSVADGAVSLSWSGGGSGGIGSGGGRCGTLVVGIASASVLVSVSVGLSIASGRVSSRCLPLFSSCSVDRPCSAPCCVRAVVGGGLGGGHGHVVDCSHGSCACGGSVMLISLHGVNDPGCVFSLCTVGAGLGGGRWCGFVCGLELFP
jgi:hypothetical protein